MEVQERFWQELEKVKFFRFLSSPGVHSKTGWEGRGKGQALHELLDEDACYIKEEGFFVLPGGKRLEMHNEWLWKKEGESIALSHVRRGRDNPVLLFVLERSLDCEWKMISNPHICGEDIYKATVVVKIDGFDISWSVSGPKKDEVLSYIYRRSLID